MYMGSDIMINNPLRQPAISYKAWMDDAVNTKDIPGALRSFTPVLSNNAYTGWASVTLFACIAGVGCSKACPVNFVITD